MSSNLDNGIEKEIIEIFFVVHACLLPHLHGEMLSYTSFHLLWIHCLSQSLLFSELLSNWPKQHDFFMELEFPFWVRLDILEKYRNWLDLSGLNSMQCGRCKSTFYMKSKVTSFGFGFVRFEVHVDDARKNFIWKLKWPHLVWASSSVVLAQCC